ncbi:MAG: hypothetical protein ACKVS6_04190 [Planctomycetota bacterium]
MNCTKFERLVNDLAGHDVAPEMSARLSEHARLCERCAGEWRAALERAAALQTMTPWALEAAGIKPPSAGETADAVFARLAKGEGSISTLRQFTRPLAAAAGFLVLVGASYFAWNLTNHENVTNPSVASKDSSVPVANVNATLTNDTIKTAAAENGERVLNPQETSRLLLESAFQGVWPNFGLRNVTTENPANSPGGTLRIAPPYDMNDGGAIKLLTGKPLIDARRF